MYLFRSRFVYFKVFAKLRAGFLFITIIDLIKSVLLCNYLNDFQRVLGFNMDVMAVLAVIKKRCR